MAQLNLTARLRLLLREFIFMFVYKTQEFEQMEIICPQFPTMINSVFFSIKSQQEIITRKSPSEAN